jgi:hypothetical protein
VDGGRDWIGVMDVSVWTDLCSVGMLDVNIKEVVM